jgi:hypothetical protein
MVEEKDWHESAKVQGHFIGGDGIVSKSRLRFFFASLLSGYRRCLLDYYLCFFDDIIVLCPHNLNY